jgi:hypothetical protein
MAETKFALDPTVGELADDELAAIAWLGLGAAEEDDGFQTEALPAPVLRCYSGGRASIVEGNSPNSALYSPANRPNCQKPYRVAISVTVVAVDALS